MPVNDHGVEKSKSPIPPIPTSSSSDGGGGGDGEEAILLSEQFRCEFCLKVFSSRKALGGHKRVHSQEKRNLIKENCESTAGCGSSTVEEAKVEREPIITCYLCNKEFASEKATSGHMRVHKDRAWMGLHPPKGPSCPNPSSSPSPSPDSDMVDEMSGKSEEEGDLEIAGILLLLSREDRSPSLSPQVENYSPEVSPRRAMSELEMEKERKRKRNLPGDDDGDSVKRKKGKGVRIQFEPCNGSLQSPQPQALPGNALRLPQTLEPALGLAPTKHCESHQGLLV